MFATQRTRDTDRLDPQLAKDDAKRIWLRGVSFRFLTESFIFSSYIMLLSFLDHFWYLVVACCFLAWMFCFVLPRRDFTYSSKKNSTPLLCLWVLGLTLCFAHSTGPLDVAAGVMKLDEPGTAQMPGICGGSWIKMPPSGGSWIPLFHWQIRSRWFPGWSK